MRRKGIGSQQQEARQRPPNIAGAPLPPGDSEVGRDGMHCRRGAFIELGTEAAPGITAIGRGIRKNDMPGR